MPWLAWGAAGLWALALAWAGLAHPGHSQVWHPPALPGAHGVPGALGFNLAAFVLPGLLLAVQGWWGRASLPVAAGWAGRLGGWLALWSALAFAAQGLWPLDPGTAADAGANRVHATAWTLWWVAFVPAALLHALDAGHGPGRRRLAAASLAAVLLVPGCALLAPLLLPGGVAQRLAFAAWFGWWIAAALSDRSARSAQGHL